MTTPLMHVAVVQFPAFQLSPCFLGGITSVQSSGVVAEVAVDLYGDVGTVGGIGVEQFWEVKSIIQLELQRAM